MSATVIKSGWFSTPTNTPTGVAKRIAVDNPYLSKDEFIQHELAIGLNITASSPVYTSGRLDRALMAASGVVNRYCRRWFDTQTIDETRTGFTVRPYNPELVTNVLANRPYQSISAIYIQVLKWFIQIDTTAATGYLQDFPDLGYYKIVPMLSSAGVGAGSPLPAEIVDRVPLGVLWTSYTFGYGTVLTGQALAQPAGSSDLKTYQSPLGNRLWAPDQTLNVYDNGVIVASSGYTVDYPNGTVVFGTARTAGHTITADFTTNESVPFDIKEAVALMVGHMLGQGLANPMGTSGFSMQTFSMNFSGDKNPLRKRMEEMLQPYVNNTPKFI